MSASADTIAEAVCTGLEKALQSAAGNVLLRGLQASIIPPLPDFCMLGKFYVRV